jgi:hypothetical protein
MLDLFLLELDVENATADGQFAQFLDLLEVMFGCVLGQGLQIL